MAATPKDAVSARFHCGTLHAMVPAFGEAQKVLLHNSLRTTVHAIPAAQQTVSYVQVVEQEGSPGGCLLLSTSEAARKNMTKWREQSVGFSWVVKLDVRDLGGRLGVTQRASAVTLGDRAKEATFQVLAVWCPHPGGSTDATVLQDDLTGQNAADNAADLGRIRQHVGAVDAGRGPIRARMHWYLVMLELHKFMVALSRTEVNHVDMAVLHRVA